MAQFEHNSEKFGYLSLDELDGAQSALAKLGYDPGAADGLDGPKTRAAVTQFQKDVNIKVDGVVGSETKGALVAALDFAAEPPPTEQPA